MQKTIIAELDIQQALEGIECPRPHIEALRNEMLNGKLEDIINILLENKTCDSVISAIRFLLQSDKFSTNGQEKVHLGDIKKVSSNKRFYDQLDRLREKQKLGSLRDRSRIFGVKGHVAIPTLFSRILQETLTFLDDSSQLGFNFEDPHEPTLRDLLPEASKVVKVAQRKMSTNRRIKKIEELWKQVVDLLKVIRFPSHKRPYKLLVELLKPVYKKDLKEILDMGARF